MKKKNFDVDDIENKLRRFKFDDDDDDDVDDDVYDIENEESRLAMDAEDEIKIFKEYTQNYEYVIENKDTFYKEN